MVGTVQTEKVVSVRSVPWQAQFSRPIYQRERESERERASFSPPTNTHAAHKPHSLSWHTTISMQGSGVAQKACAWFSSICQSQNTEEEEDFWSLKFVSRSNLLPRKINFSFYRRCSSSCLAPLKTSDLPVLIAHSPINSHRFNSVSLCKSVFSSKFCWFERF